MSEVDHPAHYGGDTPYEVMKVLRAWDLELAKGFCWGNVIKYTQRAGRKGSSALADRQKADWYATELVSIEAELATHVKKAPSEIPLVINGHGNYKLHVDWDKRTTRLEYMGGGSGSSNAPGPVTGGIGGSSVGGGGGATHFNTGTGSNYASGVGGGGGGAHWPEPVTPVKHCASFFNCKGGYHDRRCPLHIPRSGNG